jgi:hypothetical protein
METRKDNLMTSQPISPKEKKLQSLRKILWIVFSAITITILLVSFLFGTGAYLFANINNFASLFGTVTGKALILILALILVKIGVTGIILLVIYYIFKYRLEKDDDLFL